MRLIPRNDQVVIQPDAPILRGGDLAVTSLIVMPGQAEEPACTGIVLAAGPGKWVSGEWWKVKRWKYGSAGPFPLPGPNVEEYVWEWIPGHREPIDLMPGQRVKFLRYAGMIFDNVEFGGEFTGLRLMKGSEIELILPQ